MFTRLAPLQAEGDARALVLNARPAWTPLTHLRSDLQQLCLGTQQPAHHLLDRAWTPLTHLPPTAQPADRVGTPAPPDHLSERSRSEFGSPVGTLAAPGAAERHAGQGVASAAGGVLGLSTRVGSDAEVPLHVVADAAAVS